MPFYAKLRRCRKHSEGRGRGVDHRTSREHECDARAPAACLSTARSYVCLNDPLDPLDGVGETPLSAR